LLGKRASGEEATMRSWAAVIAIVTVGLVWGPETEAGELSLSRLVIRQKSGQGLRGIDVATVTRFCGDADGCQLVVTLQGPYEAASFTTRLFADAGLNNRWFTEGTTTAYSWDSDGGADPVFSLVSGAYTCGMDDGDYFNPGLDFNAGFELGVFGGVSNEATCTVTIAD
jgi:hypothetical protein